MGRLNKWKLLERLYVTLFATRMLVFLILQSIYVTCLGQARRLSKLNNDDERTKGDLEQANSCVDSTYQFMAAIGSNFRLLKGVANFFYALYVVLPCIKYLSDYFVIKNYVNLEKNEFYLYLTDLDASRRIIRARLNSCLSGLIKSNQNHLESSSCHCFGKSVGHRCRNSWLGKQGACSLQDPVHGEWHMEKQRRSHLLAIQSQHAHLESLRTNMAPIWPLNRRDTVWQRQVRQYSLILYMGAQISFWTLLIIISHLAHQESIEQHRLTGLPITWIDKLTFFEELLYNNFIVAWFTHPFALMLMNLVDQILSLKQLWQRSLAMLRKIKSVERVEKYDMAQLMRVQIECDREAIELYINYNYLVKDMDGCLKLIGFITSQFFVIIACVILAQLVFINQMETSQVRLTLIINLITLGVVNVILVGASAFNAACLKIIKLTWSFIGQPLEQLEQQKVQLVTPHTLMLWRRLNEDHLQTIGKLSCKLFNSFRINYTFVLQLNFWFISVLILVKSTSLLA